MARETKENVFNKGDSNSKRAKLIQIESSKFSEIQKGDSCQCKNYKMASGEAKRYDILMSEANKLKRD
jgi:hypothetical protein